ncbi:MAG TPA: MarR family transcriptional regulator, partial [Trichococcus flocculiformis]|nr:MarR family transcriptional regulator [Trichococcus flocculiformis]
MNLFLKDRLKISFVSRFIEQRMISADNRALKEFRLTFPQYLVLLVLWDDNRILIKHIGERLGMGIGTLNPILNRLEKQGWLTKEPSLLDKRAIIVALSEKAVTSKKAIHVAILS